MALSVCNEGVSTENGDAAEAEPDAIDADAIDAETDTSDSDDNIDEATDAGMEFSRYDGSKAILDNAPEMLAFWQSVNYGDDPTSSRVMDITKLFFLCLNAMDETDEDFDLSIFWYADSEHID